MFWAIALKLGTRNAISSNMKGNPAKHCTKVMLNASAHACNMHSIQLLSKIS